jgi:hypothetical protein
MLNHGSTLLQMLCCLSLSRYQLESKLPPAAQFLLSQFKQGDLVGHHLWLWSVLREFLDPVMTTLHDKHKHRKYFFMNILFIGLFCPQKRHNRMLLLGSKLPFRLLKPASVHVHVCLLPRLLWSWTVTHRITGFLDFFHHLVIEISSF